MLPTLTASRVVVVSGKGGVGKTTVAAALAVATARAGKNTLLAEIEDRRAFAPLFGLAELGYEERPVSPNLTAIEVEADEALIDYLRQFYGIPKLARPLVQSRAVEFATHTAPGLRDILLIGKVKEAEQRRRQEAYVYDTIVVDAPPTGRLPRFLDAPRAVASLVRGGPIRTQAQGVLDMIQDPKRLQVVLVVQPEEMPVRETADAIETLEKMQVAVGPIVVNGLWPSIPKATEPDLRAAASASSIQLSDAAFAALADLAESHARRERNQRKAIKVLRRDVKQPFVDLPYLFADRIGRAQLETLADSLEGAL